MASCEACFRAHRKCSLGAGDDDDHACARCVDRGLVCVRRKRRRMGRPPAVAVRVASGEQLKTSADDASAAPAAATPASSSASAAAPPAPDLVPDPTPALAQEGKVDDAVQVSQDALEALFPHASCLLQYRFAAALSAILKAQNLQKAPPALASYLRIMGEMSAAENSAPLLHAFTTLAVSLGLGASIPFPSAASQAPQKLPTHPTFLTLDADGARLFDDDIIGHHDQIPAACCYMVVIENGKRHLQAGPSWEKHFIPLETMQKTSNAKPGYYKFWLDAVADIDDRARRLHRCLREWLDVPMVYDEAGQESFWHFCGTIPDVRVRDRNDHLWLVDIVEFDVFVCGAPSRLRHSIKLFNFRPLSQEAQAEATIACVPLTTSESFLRMPPGEEAQIFAWDEMDLEPLDSLEINGPLEEYLADPSNPFRLDDLL